MVETTQLPKLNLSAVTFKLFPSTRSVYIDGKNINPKCFPIPQLIILHARNELCHTVYMNFKLGCSTKIPKENVSKYFLNPLHIPENNNAAQNYIRCSTKEQRTEHRI